MALLQFDKVWVDIGAGMNVIFEPAVGSGTGAAVSMAICAAVLLPGKSKYFEGFPDGSSPGPIRSEMIVSRALTILFKSWLADPGLSLIFSSALAIVSRAPFSFSFLLPPFLAPLCKSVLFFL